MYNLMVKYPSVIYYSDRNMSVTEGGANMGNLRKLYMGASLVVKKTVVLPGWMWVKIQ